MRFNGAELARIDCKTRFEVHGQHIGIVGDKAGLEKSITVNGHQHEGKLCFNMNLNLDKNRRMVRDLPYSISEWDGQVRAVEDYWYKTDRIIIEENATPEETFEKGTYINGIYWVCVKDKKSSVAVFNKGCMGAAVNGNRLSVPLVYANEYLCGTKMLDGIYEDEFAISFDYESDAELHRLALSYAYPPAVVSLEESDGNLTEFKPFSLESKGGEVILTTFYPEDGNLLARFCNYSDEAATAELNSVVGQVTSEVDLLGNEFKKITDGKLSFRPWEIKTVKIKL